MKLEGLEEVNEDNVIDDFDIDEENDNTFEESYHEDSVNGEYQSSSSSSDEKEVLAAFREFAVFDNQNDLEVNSLKVDIPILYPSHLVSGNQILHIADLRSALIQIFNRNISEEEINPILIEMCIEDEEYVYYSDFQLIHQK